MKLKIIFLTLLFVLIPKIAVAEEFVEEVVQEPVVVAEPAYTPPPEALEGVGGWAIVDESGNVRGVLVCTADVCGPDGEWGGKMPDDVPDCAGCDLRFQTKASEDGNVAGWRSQEDRSVTYNSSDDSFDIQSEATIESGGTIKKKQKIKAGKVDSDSNGLEDISTEYAETVEEKTVEVVVEETVEPKPVSVEYKEWKRFEYESPEVLLSEIDTDIQESFVSEGYEVDNGDESVVESSFVVVIKDLTQRVKNFIFNIFGG